MESTNIFKGNISLVQVESQLHLQKKGIGSINYGSFLSCIFYFCDALKVKSSSYWNSLSITKQNIANIMDIRPNFLGNVFMLSCLLPSVWKRNFEYPLKTFDSILPLVSFLFERKRTSPRNWTFLCCYFFFLLQLFFFVFHSLCPGSKRAAYVRLSSWILCCSTLLSWDGVHLYWWERKNQR